MSLPSISVIIPTVEGREPYLDRCARAYRTHSLGHYVLELVVEHDHPTCGLGWHLGAGRATGDYLHFTCDDIEPRPGWAAPAIEAVKAGYIPAPQVFDPSGYPQSHPQVGMVAEDWTPVVMTALPFVSREQYGKIAPLLTTHYYCVVPETPVLTAALEWVPAGKLSLGDELVGVDEFPEAGRARCRKYRRAVVTGSSFQKMECVTVYLEDGREVTCSLDHMWLTKGYRSDFSGVRNVNGIGWVTAKKLRAGDRILSPLRVWDTETSFEAGWLAGIFDGEGSAGRYRGNRGDTATSLTVAQNPGPVLYRIRAGLDALGISYREYGNGSQSPVVRVHVSTFSDALELLGRIRPTRLRSEGLWEGAAVRGKPAVYGTVDGVAPAGQQWVSALGTSTGTFLANGLVAHNSDDWFSFRAERAGWPTRLRTGYAFTHWWAQVKRGAQLGSEAVCMTHDEPLYQEARRMAEAGQWDAPWPLEG